MLSDAPCFEGGCGGSAGDGDWDEDAAADEMLEEECEHRCATPAMARAARRFMN